MAKIFRPTLHVFILTLFMVFLMISAGTLTWFNYKKNSGAALDIADSLMDEVNEKIMERIHSMFEAIFRLAHDTAELPQLADKPVFMRHGAQWFLAESLLVHEHIYSVYIGYSDGDFYQIISLRRIGPELRARLGAPESAFLAVRRVFDRPLDGRRIELWQFFDRARIMVGSRTERESRYDPRERPWFKQAIGVERAVHTPFYVFTSTGTMGLTVARRFDGPVPGVFGVDVTLDELSFFFADQHVGSSGIVFMFDGEGRLTAYPDPAKTIHTHSLGTGRSLEQAPLDTTGEPLLAALSERLKRGEVEERMTFDGDYGKYLMHVTPVRDERLGDQYVAVAALASDFTGNMDQTRRTSLIFGLVIVLLAIPVAIYFSRLISRPLRKLAGEADDIRRFNLESPIDIESRIAEVADLATAVKAMKSSLFSFGRYVPKALARRILLSDMDTRLGGERRELTLMFTDVVGFTSLAEGMEPEELMLQMSDYLQVIGSEILAREGTIDKFIGDSVMAFWNAPVYQDNHAALACEAALQARRAGNKLNAAWEAHGIPRMETRFGLLTGEAVVGNVGSEDRMDYTVVGSAVNLASRLEGLNKFYGTEILVSESVRQRAGDGFVFRSVGMVLPKGTTSPVRVYELLGMAASCVEDLSAPQNLCTTAAEWETAHAAYREQRFGEAARLFADLAAAAPEDRLAALMMERSHQLQADPPGEGWDGVDIFKTK